MEELMKEILIEDIKDTRFYKEIMDTIKKDKIVAYNISFIRKDTKVPVFEFIGGGDIDWKRIEGAINDHNLTEYNLHKKNNNYHAFHVDIDTLYLPTYLLLGTWSGRVMLSNGECIYLMEDVAPRGADGFIHVGITRYSAKIETVTEDFSFKVNKGKAYYLPCVR